VTAFGDDEDHISRIFGDLKSVGTKGQLGEAIYGHLARLSFVDLAVLAEALQYEIGALPSPYREMVGPYMEEELLGRYYRVLAMHSDGSLGRMRDAIRDRALFEAFCDAAVRFGADLRTAGEGCGHHLQLGGLSYFLLHGFALFVLDEPGHPVGMPVLGGLTVQKRDGKYYCPARGREQDTGLALCAFCPAAQDDVYANWCAVRGFVL
jgi:hypothetical protein